PLRVYVEAEPGRWRDAATLAPVADGAVRRAAQQARLVALVGDPAALAGLATPGALLVWPTTGGRDGDWYVEPPSASPLAGYLAGIAWDSLPPASAVSDLPPDTGALPVLQARLARRGASRPIAVLSDQRGSRRATVAATGLWRWGFRGGASDVAYRTLIGAITDWLLGGGDGRGERFVPVTNEAPNGLPLLWRWVGKSDPQDVVMTLTGPAGARADTLRFDAAGRAGPDPAWSDDARARDLGQVSEGRRSQAGRGARPARHPHGRGSAVPRAAPLPRRHHGDAARARVAGERGDLRGARRHDRHPPDPPRPAGLPRGVARRQRAARVCVARPAVSRAADQAGTAAAGERARAVLSRPPARAARIHRAGRKG